MSLPNLLARHTFYTPTRLENQPATVRFPAAAVHLCPAPFFSFFPLPGTVSHPHPSDVSMFARRFSWFSMLTFLPRSSRPFVFFLSFCAKSSSKPSAPLPLCLRVSFPPPLLPPLSCLSFPSLPHFAARRARRILSLVPALTFHLPCGGIRRILAPDSRPGGRRKRTTRTSRKQHSRNGTAEFHQHPPDVFPHDDNTANRQHIRSRP